MTVRPVLIAATFLVFTSPIAFAHSEGHESDEEKPIPTTCSQLADTQRYSNDVSYPEIKALKARCDAKKSEKSSPEAPAGKTN